MSISQKLSNLTSKVEEQPIIQISKSNRGVNYYNEKISNAIGFVRMIFKR